MGDIILALITVSIGTFSVLRFVRRSRMLHPNEAHKGAGVIHFDGHLVMQRPFVVAHGSVAFAPA